MVDKLVSTNSWVNILIWFVSTVSSESAFSEAGWYTANNYGYTEFIHVLYLLCFEWIYLTSATYDHINTKVIFHSIFIKTIAI